jgi:arylsulfatase A-like enzyme
MVARSPLRTPLRRMQAYLALNWTDMTSVPMCSGIRSARRAAVLAACLVAVLPLFFSGCKRAEPKSPPQPPNIILITLESLRFDHAGCYGYERDTTPNLDALAEEGIRFEAAYSPTSWTLAAHASLFTGLYPTATNIVYPKDRLDDSYITLAERLSESGYHTAAAVSGPYLRKAFKLNQGFKEYFDGPITRPDGKAVGIGDVTNPKMEAAITAFLDREAQRDRPFFLFGYFWDPHYDYIPPKPYDTMFVPDNAEPISLEKYDTPANPFKADCTPGQMAYVVAQYDGEIRCTDEVLGRIIERLKANGQWDNTAIIVTADHGEEFFEHGHKGHKNTIHVESVRVPLVIKPPAGMPASGSGGQAASASAAGRVDERLASLVDIYPTVCQWAGITAGQTALHGHSLLEPDPGQPVYCELATSWYFHRRSTGEKWRESDIWWGLRDGRYRLIGAKMHDVDDARWTLYDVAEDPGEQHPLVGEKEELLARLRERTQAWDDHLKKLASKIGESGQAVLTEAELEQLRSLGYIK